MSEYNPHETVFYEQAKEAHTTPISYNSNGLNLHWDKNFPMHFKNREDVEKFGEFLLKVWDKKVARLRVGRK